MAKLKLKDLDISFMLSQVINDKHIIYIDTNNKQYRIAWSKNNPIIANYGDIFTTCYNLIKSGHSLPRLDHINLNDFIDCLNSKTISKSLRDYIKSFDMPFNFQLGIFKDKPVFYLDCYLYELFIYDLLNIIDNKDIKLKVCSNCGRLFIKSYNNQAWCDNCLNQDKSRKNYQQDYYAKHFKSGNPDKIYRNIYQSVTNKLDINEAYKIYILKLIESYSKDIESLKIIRSLTLIQPYLFEVYQLYKIDINKRVSIDKLYSDLCKCEDISTFEAWFISILEQLPKREYNRLLDKINAHVLNNKRTNEDNKQALINELNKLKQIVECSGKDKR